MASGAWKIIEALIADARWAGVADQRALQRQLERTLFTYCDGVHPGAGSVGLHWSFDWLFEPGQALSIAVGRVFDSDEPYTLVAFKHQTNELGLVYEVSLPTECYRFDEGSGVLDVTFDGAAEVRVHRLHLQEAEIETRRVAIALRKETSAEGRPWKSSGSLQVFDTDADALLCRWTWDYRLTRLVDRPDYNVEAMLDVLDSDLPGVFGHFIPALSAEVAGGITYAEADGVEHGSAALQGCYLDGNFARVAADRAERLLQDHWGWLVVPRLWTPEGVPVEHMFMAGFFKATAPSKVLAEWTGVVSWRRGPDQISTFRIKELLTRVAVRHHSPSYLDVTMITADNEYRITFRVWLVSMVSEFVPPGSRRFRDHQDLLADAYVVVEQNTARWPLGRIKPSWRVVDRLVTNMAGCEFGERDSAIGCPDYPAYAAVPEKPPWLTQALACIPTTPFQPQTTAYRLESIQPPP
jgi:hypothetical protein